MGGYPSSYAKPLSFPPGEDEGKLFVRQVGFAPPFPSS